MEVKPGRGVPHLYHDRDALCLPNTYVLFAYFLAQRITLIEMSMMHREIGERLS